MLKLLKKIFKTKKKTIFLAQREDGLGARLGSILNAIALSYVYKGEYKVIWHENYFIKSEHHSISKAKNIFCYQMIKNHIATKKDIQDLKKTKVFELSKLFEHDKKIDNKEKYYNTSFKFSNSIREKYIPQEPHFFNKIFFSIKFSKEVSYAIKLANNIKLPKDALAIHLRAGDLIYGIFYELFILHQYVIPYPVAINIIQSKTKENIILFSQDIKLDKFLSSLYKVLSANRFRPEKLTNLQRSFFDIVLMSRCKKIIAGASSFAHLSSVIGKETKLIKYGDLVSEEKQAQIIFKYLKAEKK